MTTRRRRSRTRGARRGRTGRLVWVNREISLTGIIDARQTLDLLLLAESFMVFDTTIVRVVIPELTFSFTNSGNTQNTRSARMALMVGQSSLDADDFEPLFTDSVGPPWLGLWGANALVNSSQLDLTLNLVEGFSHIDVASSRRFRENDATLFMILQNRCDSGDTGLEYRGYARTLIRIP